MIEQRFLVGVILAQHTPASPWASAYWVPDQVLASPAAAEPWTEISRTTDCVRVYAGAATVDLYSTDTANYLTNMATGQPKLWVVLRPSVSGSPIEVVRVTADPAEGEAFTENGNDTVEALPMPAEIAQQVMAFCESHHVERVFEKRQRNRVLPDLSRKGN